MATIPVTTLVETGNVVPMAAPTATVGDSYGNTGREIVRVNNASGGAINVTFKGKKPCDTGGVIHDSAAYSVAAGTSRDFKSPSPAAFNDPVTGLTTFVCSAVASITVGVYRAN